MRMDTPRIRLPEANTILAPQNPDAVCLERLDRFLHETKKLGITVLRAGIQSDFIAAIEDS